MIAGTLSPPRHLPSTFREKSTDSRWRSYVSTIERKIIMRAQALAGRPARALEMGCEGEEWAKMLSELGWNMTCVDANSSSLAICKAKLPEATCILTKPQAATIPCVSSSQSLLLCIQAAPIIQSGWFMAEAARVLKDNGIVVGVFSNRHSVRGWFVNFRRRLAGAFDDIYSKPYSSLRNELANHGLSLIYEEGFCWGPFAGRSNSPLIPAFAFAERLLCLNRIPHFSPWIAFIAKKRAP
jgi:SAM-dependent methyltransferase